MANQEHLNILKQGVDAWNQWRQEHTDIRPDLRGVDLRRADLYRADLTKAHLNEADLSYANLSYANLTGAHFREVHLNRANLAGANLTKTHFTEANLYGADLHGAKLTEADLKKADLSFAHLSRADLTGADLRRATLVETNFAEATLTNCNIYGISAWNVKLEGAIQKDLVITPYNEPIITVDNLKIAQFIYLLLNNAEIREVVDTIAKKAVLILGRFTPERKFVLDAIKDTLRRQGYLPILFDFERPSRRNLTETVRTLAHLSRFIIADLTDPSSIPQELQAIIPTLAIPIQPVLLEGKKEYAMFVDFLKTYHWVLPIQFYKDEGSLLAKLKERVIEPAEQKAQELEKR